jgi:cellulose synthase/poly-beta-1,6-N-acetylglucosamine synthase-like glycosyltransferase
MILIFISIVLALAYAMLILLYRWMWDRDYTFKYHVDSGTGEKISVIVPCRNEASNIDACIKALLNQDYPANLLEIIVVDDHSTDRTSDIAQSFSDQGVRLVRLSDTIPHLQGKKAAISQGVAISTGTVIFTTDADCIVPVNWIRSMSACRKASDAAFVSGPVMFRGDHNPLDIFQTLDFLSLQGITAASVSAGFHGMSNGANMGFTREAFNTVGGFEGIDHIASGDDMLLMQKIQQRFPGRIAYCRSTDAIVRTRPEPTLRAFLRQRIRWASKATHYRDKRILPVLMLVYLHNVSLLILLLSGIFGYTSTLVWAIILLTFKTIVELIFLWPVAGFFGLKHLLPWFPFAQPFHILYTVISGGFGQFGSYQWKGRTVR